MEGRSDVGRCRMGYSSYARDGELAPARVIARAYEQHSGPKQSALTRAYQVLTHRIRSLRPGYSSTSRDDEQ